MYLCLKVFFLSLVTYYNVYKISIDLINLKIVLLCVNSTSHWWQLWDLETKLRICNLVLKTFDCQLISLPQAHSDPDDVVSPGTWK